LPSFFFFNLYYRLGQTSPSSTMGDEGATGIFSECAVAFVPSWDLAAKLIGEVRKFSGYHVCALMLNLTALECAQGQWRHHL
jgi:hypothetical protein